MRLVFASLLILPQLSLGKYKGNQVQFLKYPDGLEERSTFHTTGGGFLGMQYSSTSLYGAMGSSVVIGPDGTIVYDRPPVTNIEFRPSEIWHVGVGVQITGGGGGKKGVLDVPHLMNKLWASATLRDNLVTVFGYILHVPNNPLSYNLYYSLFQIYNQLRHRIISVIQILPQLKVLSNLSPQQQFIVVFTELRKTVPRYLVDETTIWIEGLKNNEVDVSQIIRPDGKSYLVDLLAGIPPKLFTILGDPVYFNQKVMKYSSPEISVLMGPLVANIFAALKDGSLELTQHLFAALVVHRPLNLNLPASMESERYLVDYLRVSKLKNWNDIVKNISPVDKQNPYTLMRTVLIAISKSDVGIDIKYNARFILPQIIELLPTSPNLLYPLTSHIMSEPVLDITYILRAITTSDYPDYIIELRNRLLYYIKHGHLDVSAVTKGFNRFDHTRPQFILIAFLTRVSHKLPNLPDEILSTVKSLQLYLIFRAFLCTFAPVLPNHFIDVPALVPALNSPDLPKNIRATEKDIELRLDELDIDWPSILKDTPVEFCSQPIQCLLYAIERADEEGVLPKQLKTDIDEVKTKLQEAGYPSILNIEDDTRTTTPPSSGGDKPKYDQGTGEIYPGAGQDGEKPGKKKKGKQSDDQLPKVPSTYGTPGGELQNPGGATRPGGKQPGGKGPADNRPGGGDDDEGIPKLPGTYGTPGGEPNYPGGPTRPGGKQPGGKGPADNRPGGDDDEGIPKLPGTYGTPGGEPNYPGGPTRPGGKQPGGKGPADNRPGGDDDDDGIPKLPGTYGTPGGEPYYPGGPTRPGGKQPGGKGPADNRPGGDDDDDGIPKLPGTYGTPGGEPYFPGGPTRPGGKRPGGKGPADNRPGGDDDKGFPKLPGTYGTPGGEPNYPGGPTRPGGKQPGGKGPADNRPGGDDDDDDDDDDGIPKLPGTYGTPGGEPYYPGGPTRPGGKQPGGKGPADNRPGGDDDDDDDGIPKLPGTYGTPGGEPYYPGGPTRPGGKQPGGKGPADNRPGDDDDDGIPKLPGTYGTPGGEPYYPGGPTRPGGKRPGGKGSADNQSGGDDDDGIPKLPGTYGTPGGEPYYPGGPTRPGGKRPGGKGPADNRPGDDDDDDGIPKLPGTYGTPGGEPYYPGGPTRPGGKQPGGKGPADNRPGDDDDDGIPKLPGTYGTPGGEPYYPGGPTRPGGKQPGGKGPADNRPGGDDDDGIPKLPGTYGTPGGEPYYPGGPTRPGGKRPGGKGSADNQSGGDDDDGIPKLPGTYGIPGGEPYYPGGPTRPGGKRPGGKGPADNRPGGDDDDDDGIPKLPGTYGTPGGEPYYPGGPTRPGGKQPGGKGPADNRPGGDDNDGIPKLPGTYGTPGGEPYYPGGPTRPGGKRPGGKGPADNRPGGDDNDGIPKLPGTYGTPGGELYYPGGPAGPGDYPMSPGTYWRPGSAPPGSDWIPTGPGYPPGGKGSGIYQIPGIPSGIVTYPPGQAGSPGEVIDIPGVVEIPLELITIISVIRAEYFPKIDKLDDGKPANPDNPSELLQESPPGSPEDLVLKPLRVFFEKPDLYTMLGPEFNPRKYPTKGQLRIAILQAALSSTYVIKQPKLHATIVLYLNYLENPLSPEVEYPPGTVPYPYGYTRLLYPEVPFPQINIVFWHQVATPDHPEELLPPVRNGTIDDIKMRPLRMFLAQPNLYGLLGPAFNPNKYRTKLDLLRAIIEASIKLPRVRQDMVLYHILVSYLKYLENPNMERVTSSFLTLLKALPVPRSDYEKKLFILLTEFLGTPNLLSLYDDTLNLTMFHTIGPSLKFLLKQSLQIEQVQKNVQLLEAVNYYLPKVRMDGYGAYPIKWVLHDVKYTSVSFDLGEIFKAIDSQNLTPEAKKAKKELINYLNAGFNPQQHFKGFNFKPYKTNGELLRAAFQFILQHNTVPTNIKSSISVLLPYVRTTGPGANPVKLDA